MRHACAFPALMKPLGQGLCIMIGDVSGSMGLPELARSNDHHLGGVGGVDHCLSEDPPARNSNRKPLNAHTKANPSANTKTGGASAKTRPN
jgi:hypothetical protein